MATISRSFGPIWLSSRAVILKKEEGRGKKEEGRRKKEEGRRKKEEGRRKKEEGKGRGSLPFW